MFVGSFEGDFVQFQFDVKAAVNEFKAQSVKNLLIDVTNNGGDFVHSSNQTSKNLTLPLAGGYVCLGLFLYRYLVGKDYSLPYELRM